jgi:adenylate cyclase
VPVQSFLSELKRRNVYRAALIYAAAGWVLLQIADIVFPRLGLPEQTVNYVLLLAALGSPFAIVFAWFFDITPEGIVRTPPLSPGERHQFSPARIVDFVLIGTLVITVGYLYVDRLSLQKSTGEPEPPRPELPAPGDLRAIAVLPFADMSESGDQAWFAEGIAEELLHALASVQGLHVMARTSSFAFKDTNKTIAEIAEILGVQAVLEGSVRRSDHRVRITAQLIDASSGYHVWSGSYEREFTQIFELQDELAKAIVQALRLELGVSPAVQLVAAQTENEEAYNWFLRGRAAWSWATPETHKQGISYFEKAVEADPDYAAAWGYLAFARVVSMLWQTADEVGPSIVSAYERALLLDPEQSQALPAKALMTQLVERDWAAAGKLYRRALVPGETESGVPGAAYSVLYLALIDRFEEAIRLNMDAEKRDPLHAGYKSNLAEILRLSGDNEAAARKAREALAIDPGYLLAIYYLASIYTVTENFTAVQNLLEDIPPGLRDLPLIRSAVGRYYAQLGEEDRARQIYRELKAQRESLMPVALLSTAALALSLGEVEQSLDLQELLVDKGSYVQFFIRPYFRDNEALREHPRYLALLRRMGLDDESVAALNKNLPLD